MIYEGKFVYDILDENILLCGVLVFFENNQFIEQIIKIYSIKDDGITKHIADELRRNSEEFIISKI